jgi:hypothetical protein
MTYTGKDVRRDADEYQAWAKKKDDEQFKAYVAWLRESYQRIKREEGIYESECRVVSA